MASTALFHRAGRIVKHASEVRIDAARSYCIITNDYFYFRFIALSTAIIKNAT